MSKPNHQKFRTNYAEEFVRKASGEIFSGADLITTLGSNSVSSTTFSQHTINVGDSIHIDEALFNTSGYQVVSVSGQTLVLNTTMPASLTNAKFTLNRLPLYVNFTHHTDGYTSNIYDKFSLSILRPENIVSNSDLATTALSKVVSSASNDFSSLASKNDILIINNGSLLSYYLIESVSLHSLTLSDAIPSTLTNQTFYIYKRSSEFELKGLNLLSPDYSYENGIIYVNNGLLPNDILIVNTYGLTNKRIIQNIYLWADGYGTNIINGKFPSPISLDDVFVTKIIFPKDAINSGTTLIDGYTTDGYRSTSFGRKLELNISGNNISSFPFSINVDGYTSNMASYMESISVTDYGTYYTTGYFAYVSSITISGASKINPNKHLLSLSIRERYPIGHSESGLQKPVIKYSFQTRVGNKLQYDAGNVIDGYQTFSVKDIDNYLKIHSPLSAAGYYKIIGLYNSNKGYQLETSVPGPSFTNGTYEVLNVTEYRSGFSNGYFVFEDGYYPGTPYNLTKGTYEFDYITNLDIPLDPLEEKVYYGSNYEGNYQADAILNGLVLYSTKLKDARDVDPTETSVRTVTKDYNSLKKLSPDETTFMLSYFDNLPATNLASYYLNSNNDHHLFYSEKKVNDSFGRCISITNEPIILDNNGILDTKKEGTIEFWTNPKYDTFLDRNDRFYFDAFGTVTEELISLSTNEIRLPSNAERIIKVSLVSGDPKEDYFAGGTIIVDSSGTITKTITANNRNIIINSDNYPLINQLVSIKILNDISTIDYAEGAVLRSDKKTIVLSKPLPLVPATIQITYKPVNAFDNSLNNQIIKLNKRLPYQRSKVSVTYLPQGVQGDRLSIFKDKDSYLNFSVRASGIDFVTKSTIHWPKNTWHRVKATYKFNGGKSTDEIKLYIDGYERGSLTYGVGLVYGDPVVYGSSYTGLSNIVGNIKFKDNINSIVIGGDYNKASFINGYIDNFRISSISRAPYVVYGDNIDFNYSSNLNNVYPVTEDLYTSFLLDFNSSFYKTDDFTLLRDKENGGFDFYMNIYDSFGYIASSDYVKAVLEKLIKVLKPANSRSFLTYL